MNIELRTAHHRISIKVDPTRFDDAALIDAFLESARDQFKRECVKAVNTRIKEHEEASDEPA